MIIRSCEFESHFGHQAVLLPKHRLPFYIPTRHHHKNAEDRERPPERATHNTRPGHKRRSLRCGSLGETASKPSREQTPMSADAGDWERQRSGRLEVAWGPAAQSAADPRLVRYQKLHYVVVLQSNSLTHNYVVLL